MLVSNSTMKSIFSLTAVTRSLPRKFPLPGWLAIPSCDQALIDLEKAVGIQDNIANLWTYWTLWTRWT